MDRGDRLPIVALAIDVGHSHAAKVHGGTLMPLRPLEICILFAFLAVTRKSVPLGGHRASGEIDGQRKQGDIDDEGDKLGAQTSGADSARV
jgi:hypothetical protein